MDVFNENLVKGLFQELQLESTFVIDLLEQHLATFK